MVWIIVSLGLALMAMECHRMAESFRNDLQDKERTDNDRQIIRGDGWEAVDWEAVDKDDNYNFE